jgi:hypothetical protein
MIQVGVCTQSRWLWAYVPDDFGEHVLYTLNDAGFQRAILLDWFSAGKDP